jgi:MFS family permease
VGRRTTFTLGISMYGVGALITALSMGLPMMILGWSLLEGLGSALHVLPLQREEGYETGSR